MDASNRNPDRMHSVQRAAELLCMLEPPCYPINIGKILTAFNQEISIYPYDDYVKAYPESIDAARHISTDALTIPMGNHFQHIDGIDYLCKRWLILFNQHVIPERIRFSLAHELGHILLGHTDDSNTDAASQSDAGNENDPSQKRKHELEADEFAAALLSPAPAVITLLHRLGFEAPGYRTGPWRVPDTEKRKNSSLNLDPVAIVKAAFHISTSAAERRLREVEDEMDLWNMEPSWAIMAKKLSGIPVRADWHCRGCHTIRKDDGPFCIGCGTDAGFEFVDSPNVRTHTEDLRPSGQFAFCVVCGNPDYPPEALYCPICGSPVLNECSNHMWTDGDFMRSGRKLIRGNHRCRPSDIYCSTCGLATHFAMQHGPKMNMWLKGGKCTGPLGEAVQYPAVYEQKERTLLPVQCPSCGSRETIRNGRFCAKCMLPLQNTCIPGHANMSSWAYDPYRIHQRSTSGSDSHSTSRPESHPCGPNDRYCMKCGSQTTFMRDQLLPDAQAVHSETANHSQNDQSKTSSGEASPDCRLMIYYDDDYQMHIKRLRPTEQYSQE